MTTTHPLFTVVDEIGPALADRAASQDRSGAFVEQNYRLLKEKRLFSAGVPAAYGGGDASHAELCEIIRRLAHHCPSTALALSMHTHLVAAAVWRDRHGQPAAPLLKSVAEAERVLVSTGANDWLESNGTAKRVDGGYRITAEKRFASGSPAGDIALTSAVFVGDDGAEQVLHFPISLRAEGVRVGDDWDTLGMRATGSHTLRFQDVFVGESAVSVRRPRGVWHPSFHVICTVAIPIYMSAYVGLAQRAVEWTLERARARKDAIAIAGTVGALRNALLTAELAHARMIDAARGYDFAPDVALADRTLACKTIAARAVRACLDECVALVGGAAYFKACPLERWWRDAQAVQFHPLPETRQMQVAGRVALGLPLEGA